jgi:hypothetical protein
MRRRRLVRRRRIALIVVVSAALSTLVWYGDLPSAIPFHTSISDGNEPLVQPPAGALRLLEHRLALSGGVPHDAQLTEFHPFTHRTLVFSRGMRGPFPSKDASDLTPVAGQVGPTSVTAYVFTYQPVDAVAWKDRISARVDADTVRTCLDGGALPAPYVVHAGPPTCRHYRMTFPLRVSSLMRDWRPRPVRALAAWWNRHAAPMVAQPAAIESGCSRPPGDAMRRIVAAISAPLLLKGRFDPRALWEPSVTAARAGRGALAVWNAPYPSVRFGPPRPGFPDQVAIREALVLDEPIGDRPERLVLIRYDGPPAQGRDVAAFVTSSDEPVCPPVRNTPAPMPSVTWSWDAIVAIVRERAHDEGLFLAANPGPAVTSLVTGSARRHESSSEIDVETSQGAQRWSMRFLVDEREPAIREAELTRL